MPARSATSSPLANGIRTVLKAITRMYSAAK